MFEVRSLQNTLPRREQRRRLRRCAVLAYIIPLFVVGSENIQNWFVGLFIESASADQVTTTVYAYAYDANGNLIEKRQLTSPEGYPNDPNDYTVLELWTYDARRVACSRGTPPEHAIHSVCDAALNLRYPETASASAATESKPRPEQAAVGPCLRDRRREARRGQRVGGRRIIGAAAQLADTSVGEAHDGIIPKQPRGRARVHS